MSVEGEAANRWAHRGLIGLLVVDALLVAAHFLWPDVRWGQGRSSYFRLGNSTTLASWFVTLQLAAVGGLAWLAPALARHGADRSASGLWRVVGSLFLVGSFLEATRLPRRLELLGLPDPDSYELLALTLLGALVIGLVGLGLSVLVGPLGSARKVLFGALAAAAVWLVCGLSSDWAGRALVAEAVRGGALLASCSLALGAVARSLAATEGRSRRASPNEELRPGRWWLAGVAAATFVLILLQVLLFRLLTIAGDYLAAQTVIAQALLGISVGALLAFWGRHAPWWTIGAAGFALGPAILFAFGATVALGQDHPLFASLCGMVPFAAGSAVISVALTHGRSHVVYCLDLVGAALGALAVAPALAGLREEGTVFALAAAGFAVGGLVIAAHPRARVRRVALGVSVALGAILLGAAVENLGTDRWNIVRDRLLDRYPQAEVLYSGSSLAGRYDVVRRAPDHKSLSAYENGHITDTIRNRTLEAYEIDPRLPHNLTPKPSILILGLSGDAITKTARERGGEVFGVEINPVVVEMQQGVLVPYNGNSYDGIDVAVVDGRTYVEQSTRQYDWITLMNAHAGRGRSSGRAPSPEYLHTREAMVTYLERLTDRGFVNIEEPVSRPSREPAVWKLLLTMRSALVEFGADDPARHFFVFQWRTRTNNYVQILMKRTPITDDELARLHRWLFEVDEIDQIEDAMGRQVGPITSKTTVLYAPDRGLETNHARIIGGDKLAPELVDRYNLRPTTDARPFHFDVDGERTRLKGEYGTTAVLALLILAAALVGTRRQKALRRATPHILGAVLTGLGYLLVEVALIQKYQVFIGSPVLAFAIVLGTLLVSSGIGSLWSGRFDARSASMAVLGIVAVVALYATSISPLLRALGSLSLGGRIAVAIATLAIPGFLMGAPFPFLMRMAKESVTASSVTLLFALNGLASALAVPLALNLASVHGFVASFVAAILCYAGVLVEIRGLRLSTRLTTVLNLALVATLTSAPWWLGRIDTPSEDRRRVYALSYGESRTSESRVFLGGDSDRISFQWIAWLIDGGDRTVLVDTGCSDGEEIDRWKIRNFASPVERLAQLGITPDEVTDVVLTHAHWDHAGDLHRYSKARIWIQDAELRYVEERLAGGRRAASGVRRSDLDALLAAAREGRLERVDGEAEVAPGIRIARGGAHTPGSQHVFVETLEGRVAIAGDVAYHYRNHQSYLPTGSTRDPAADLDALASMVAWATSPFYVLPGHDPRVMKWFDEVSEGIVRVGR